MFEPKTVPQFLKMLRILNNESQTDMADRLNLSTSYVSRLESPDYKMSKKNAKRVVDEYNLSDEEAATLYEVQQKSLVEDKLLNYLNRYTKSEDKKTFLHVAIKNIGQISDDDAVALTEIMLGTKTL